MVALRVARPGGSVAGDPNTTMSMVSGARFGFAAQLRTAYEPRLEIRSGLVLASDACARRVPEQLLGKFVDERVREIVQSGTRASRVEREFDRVV